MLRDRHPETGVPPELSDLVLVGDEPGRGARWRPGERLEQLFEDRCDELSSAGGTDHLAVDGVGEALTYSELDSRANRLARYLLDLGSARVSGWRCCSTTRCAPTSACWRC